MNTSVRLFTIIGLLVLGLLGLHLALGQLAQPISSARASTGDPFSEGSDPQKQIPTRLAYNPSQAPVAEVVTPTFSLQWVSPFNDPMYGMAWGDYDSDGDLDLVVANSRGYNRIYRNDGGNMICAWTSPMVLMSLSVAWGDWDGDGDLDLAFGDYSGEVDIYTNHSGDFNLAESFYPAYGYVYSLAWGDYNSDGLLDLAVAVWGAPVMVFRNIGGWLDQNPAWSTAASYQTTSVAWGDYDGDDHLDLAVGYNGSPNQVYTNTGSSLSLTWTAPVTQSTSSVAWGDYDRDGELDLAVGNSNQQSQVYHKAGGSLSLAWTAPVTQSTSSVAWGDWDGDGDDDLFVANWSDPVTVYRNTEGSLSVAWEGPVLSSMAWGDWEGDGDLDLAVGGWVRPARIYRNNNGASLSLAWTAPQSSPISSLAWGDVDGDGDLDLAVGNDGTPNQVYVNVDSALQDLPVWTAAADYSTTSVAWGDVDGDGDLDLAVGNYGQPNQVYPNVNGSLQITPTWTATASYNTRSLAWGDVDGDGDLDLAVGNENSPNQLYLNDGNATLTLSAWTLATNTTYSLAWSDYDGDGDLDLAVGNYYQNNQVYRNVGGELSLAWTAPEVQPTVSIAWGDWDNDGDSDLAVGNFDLPTRVYENDGGSFFNAWNSDLSEHTKSVSWADYNGDGYLDLMVGNRYTDFGSDLHRNTGGNLTFADYPAHMDVHAWGDWDGDGDLDLAAGNNGQLHLYRNASAEGLAKLGLTTGRLAYPLGGGDAAPFYASGTVLEGPTITFTYTLFDQQSDPARHIKAYYSLDGGSTWQAAVASTETITTNLAASPTGTQHTFTWDLYKSGFFGASDAVVLRLDIYQSLAVRGPFLYSLTSARTLPFRARGTQVRVVDEAHNPLPGALVFRQSASQNGDFRPYQDLAGHTLTTNPAGYLAGYGAIAKDDGLVALLPTQGDKLAFDGMDDYVNVPYQESLQPITFTVEAWIEADAWTVESWRGTVVGEEGGSGNQGYVLRTGDKGRLSFVLACGSGWSVALSDSVMETGVRYHVAGTFDGTTLTALINGVPVATATCSEDTPASTYPLDIGRSPFFADRLFDGVIGEVRLWNMARSPAEIQADMDTPLVGDEPGLVAYWPLNEGGGTTAHDQTAHGHDGTIHGATWRADNPVLYYTSAVPSPTGLDAFRVKQGGVQTLTISTTLPLNPLLLFDLEVSLEWDARYDAAYLETLQYNFQRASEVLYDWTNGQAALGQVTIYHDRQHWDDADIRIYATNRLRPNANQGGITPSYTTDPFTTTITYAPGQVRMGSVWNRYGEAGSSLGDDWPRTLAHELGHYLLYLNDNYLGLTPAGQVIPLSGCPGAMSDPYRQDTSYDEFHPDANWDSECSDTLSDVSTGRSDWKTIVTFYGDLSAYQNSNNPGPATLPLAVTQINFVVPPYTSTSLTDPTFYLTEPSGARYQPGRGARAFLFQTVSGIDRLVDLGSPVLDHVLARGARVGDRLCVFEAAAGRLGCETITANDEQLALASDPTWQPDIIVTPVTSHTITVTVTAHAALALQARLFPAAGAPTVPIALSGAGPTYTGVFHTVDPALAGYVQVWVVEVEPRREAITDYSLGGNPGRRAITSGAFQRSRLAPAMSADGQVILYGNLDFPEGEFYALQEANLFPAPLAWTTSIGPAYRLSASANAPSLEAASISISYLAADVPPGEEAWIRVYFWNGIKWQILPTTLDTYQNSASAPAQGPGVYALMSSYQVRLYPGWNVFSYPVSGARPVTQTLASIQGNFGLVYAYDPTNPSDPWSLYDPSVPPWVNDLTELSFGHGYWISVTENITTSEGITLYLKGATASLSLLEVETGFPSPPATFYGTVSGNDLWAPQAGQTVTAWVDSSTLCGQSLTKQVDGQVVYVVHVSSASQTVGCGTPGRPVAFHINDVSMHPLGYWNDMHPIRLDLLPTYILYIPLVQRRE